MTSLREATAALDLLLMRLMAVRSELNGGGGVEVTSAGYVLRVELTCKFPRNVKPPRTFMEFPVEYYVSGWASGIGVPT